MILDDVVSKEYQDQLEDLMTSLAFPWFYNKWVDKYPTRYFSVDCDESKIANSFQLSHVFFDNGAAMPTYNSVEPLVNAVIEKANISFCRVLRVKANLTTAHDFPQESYQVPHVDTSPPCRTFVYYVNDSDGDTVLFNEKVGDDISEFTISETCAPKKGRVFGFDGARYHAGRFPNKSKTRIVINIVLR